MADQVIDLAKAPFWLIVCLAVAVMVPLANGRLRKWAWAGINLTFLGLLLSKYQFAAVGGAVLLTYAVLKAVDRPGGWRKAAAVLLSGLTLGLFLVHKLPGWAASLDLGALTPVLAVLSFSYVALRIVEVIYAVYEQRLPAPDLPSAVNYLMPFHMLAAGPIQAYEDFVKQPPVPPALSRWDALEGLERITRGLVKKFILAYLLQRLFLTGFRAGGWYLLFEAQVFFLWLYLDFSALSDIALGVGRLMGVATPENFDRPYLARNMIDFWERWHISLSQFIRRNIYIPVQLALVRRTGGRRLLWCASIAFTISFVWCGLWHGISLSWLAWGVFQAVGLVATNLYRHYLTRRLGGKGVKAYLGDRRVRWLATALTYEFVAFSMVVAIYPWKELWE
jgi:D-alanyl-lipoteichoic acid acyltransferase DltB (MBOAT superfamily)